MSKLPSASLYVGDLHPDVNEAILENTFKKVGQVASVKVCRDSYYPHKSLGYAYVNFFNPADAERALDTLNNYVILGRQCRIMWSQRDPSLRRSGVGNIFIRNLSQSIDHKNLYDIFSRFGNILSCKVATDEITGKSKGFGFVHFQEQSEANKAIEAVNKTLVDGQEVYVGPFLARKERQRQWTNVYVKNLDPSIDEKHLAKIFSQYGTISSVALGFKNGVPAGFGYVNFENHEDAVKAVEALQNQEILNKSIWCGRHQKKIERAAENRRKFLLLKRSVQGTNLYVKNLDGEVDTERLRNEFSRFGKTRSVRVMIDEKGNSKGFGFVNFSNPEEAASALSMDSKVISGFCTKPLYVAYHEPKEIRKAKLAQYWASRGRRNNDTGVMHQYYPPNPNFMYGMRTRSPPPMWSHYAAAPYPVPITAGPPPNRQPNRPPNVARGRGVPTQSRKHVEERTQTDSTWAHIQNLPEDQKKLFLGEQIYPLVYSFEPDLCGKITGMLLDSGWSFESLYQLISNRDVLFEKVKEAKEVLEKARQSGEVEGDYHNEQ